MTPVEMEVALHYYYCREPFRRDSPAVKDAKAKLFRLGLLEIDEHTHIRGTDALDVYVDALRAVPLPVQKTVWVMP